MDIVEGNAEKLAEIELQNAEIDKTVKENTKNLKYLRKEIAKYLQVNMTYLD